MPDPNEQHETEEQQEGRIDQRRKEVGIEQTEEERQVRGKLTEAQWAEHERKMRELGPAQTYQPPTRWKHARYCAVRMGRQCSCGYRGK